jgi:hypothetical protein
MYALLPRRFQPSICDRIFRFGGDNDGDYLIDSKSIDEADALVSLGISDDWRFEADFFSETKRPIFAVDGTISRRRFFREFIKGLARLDNPKIAMRRFMTWRNYISFFQGDCVHIEKMVGTNGPEKFITFRGLIDELPLDHVDKFFLKVDIEVWEYRILSEILLFQSRLSGLLIEFHDVDLHLDKILGFIEEIELDVIHVHVNNYAPLSKDGIPLAIEMTFGEATKAEPAIAFPHDLDQSSMPDGENLIVKFF